MSRSAGSADLTRRRHTRVQRARILILTEGEVTEPEYLRGLSTHLRATGVRLQRLKVEGVGRDPVGVVRAAEKYSTEDGDFDEVWCVFDVDQHARLDEAVTLAGRLGYATAISNPSFEIWLLWHFADCRRRMGKSDLRKRLRDHGVDKKSIPLAFPYERHGDAMGRAGVPDAVGAPDNPGSSVCRLARSMRSAGSGRH